MNALLILSLCVVAVLSQDGPAPPRLLIPGAIQVGRPVNHRQGRVQGPHISGGPRLRRPGGGRPSFKSVDASPRPNLQSLDEPAKPVTEEPEDEFLELNTPPAFQPNQVSFQQNQQNQISYQQNQIFSTPDAQNDYYDATTTAQPKPIIFQQPLFQQSTPNILRPDPIRPTQYKPYNPIQTPVQHQIRNELPPKPQQPARIQPLSARPVRPQFRPEPRPQLFEDDEPAPVPVRQYHRPAPQEPVTRSPLKSAPPKYTLSNQREKKPVAQIIRKYRDENPDGSITWGFENDDGSFKEETIGVDCVTRGKYGYVDPDGLKREYSYETGILCDKNKEEQEEKGFVDYQENKAVLPNGITIDLAAMGKKSKRPFRSPSNH